MLLLLLHIALAVADEAQWSEDHFSPMVAFAALVVFLIVLFVIAVVVLAAAIMVAASMALAVAAGIVSTAALIGVLRRRFSSGFRALHYQLFAVAMIPAGIASCWLGVYLLDWSILTRSVFLIGSAAGLCGGLALACIFDWLVSLAYQRFVTDQLFNSPEKPLLTRGN